MELQRQYIITKAVEDINSPVKKINGTDKYFVIDVGQMRVINEIVFDSFLLHPQALHNMIMRSLERYEQELAVRHEL